MAKQVFKLQQVLNFRQEEEKRCIQEFVAAREEYESACNLLEEDIRTLKHLDEEAQRQQQEGITALELQLYVDFFHRKSLDIRLQRLETERLSCIVTEKREILVAAAKDKKALEILKEKKMLEHKREQNEKERLFLEEIAIRNKFHGS